MTSETNGSIKRSGKLKHVQEEAPNWVIILGGALVSTLSIRFCCKLKQLFEERSRKTCTSSKENVNLTPNRIHESSKLHSQLFCFTHNEDGCYQCHTVILDDLAGAKHSPGGLMFKDGDISLPLLVKVPPSHSSINNGEVTLASIHDYLEQPPKPFNRPNSSDSPCISESGSNVYSKREVIQKLRQQLKERDDMIMQMQAQMTDLQNSLTLQMAQTTLLLAQLDSSNHELLDSERDIQRLRKAIVDHGAGESASPKKPLPKDAELRHASGYLTSFDDAELLCVCVEKAREEGDRIEMLKREVKKLKEVIEGNGILDSELQGAEACFSGIISTYYH